MSIFGGQTRRAQQPNVYTFQSEAAARQWLMRQGAAPVRSQPGTYRTASGQTFTLRGTVVTLSGCGC